LVDIYDRQPRNAVLVGPRERIPTQEKCILPPWSVKPSHHGIIAVADSKDRSITDLRHELASNRWRYAIFSDGSKSDKGLGFAWLAFRLTPHPFPFKHELFKLRDYNTIFQAELMGIERAVKFALPASAHYYIL
jgi:hypothetical protein